jgi:hypothetical protein
MKKSYIYALFIFLLCNSAVAQTTSLRGMYIDDFDEILGDTDKEDSLLQYALDSSYNYLALYSLHSVNLNDPNTANTMADFIRKAKVNYSIPYVGAVSETFSGFQNRITPYNLNRSDDNERFNVFNLEFEFWTQSSVNPGGYYCTQYLQPNNCSCDTSGGFKWFINQIHKIDSIANLQNIKSETYLGWFNEGQAQQITQNVDRILLHAYRTNTSSLYGYSKTRLEYLASNNQVVEVAPIFSSEPDFMGPWLDAHGQIEAYNEYKDDYDTDNASWQQYINLLGYHWFDWGYMPKPVPGSSGTFNPILSASGPVTFCTGGSVTLTATTGNTYSWSNGATTQSITVTSSGSYSCDVTLNGTTSTTTTAVVSVKNYPSVTISAGIQTPSQVTLTSNATAGSGSISTYQWKLNNNNISGATSSSYTAVTSGGYTVKVTNSYGCTTTSSIQNIVLSNPGCTPSVPTGLTSTEITTISRLLSWDPGQLGDSIIIRYKPDSAADHLYVRMANTSQSSTTISGLLPNTLYTWKVRMGCGSTPGAYSSNDYFTTGTAPTGIDDIITENDFKAYPNPADNKVNIEFESAVSSKGEINVHDINGRQLFFEKSLVNVGTNKYALNTSSMMNGLYFISIKSDEKVITKKITVSH